MTGAVHTFTTIHAGVDAPPYAVVVADVGERRLTGRVDGDVSWLAVGAPVTLVRHEGRWEITAR